MSGSGAQAYGPIARRVIGALDANDPVVLFDHMGSAEAVRDCAARKFRGESFFVRAILPREGTIRADAVAATILSTYASLDDRRVAFEQAFSGTLQVNNQLLRDIPAYTPQALRLAQAAFRLADGVLVSSEAERNRVQALLQTEPPTRTIPLIDPTVPPVSAQRGGIRNKIVIWAPDTSGDAASAFTIALGELRIPIALITQSAPTRETGAQWYSLERAAEALDQAAVVIDASPYGCDAVRALAAWKAPLVVDAESGANEIVEGARTYQRERWGSIFEAVVAQLGAESPRERTPAVRPVLETRVDLPTNGPLVSIVLPTLDRPKMVREAIESIERQTYRNIQPIVVIDGGPSLAHLEPLFPRVRFIHMSANDPIASTHAAFAAATGEYIAILNDDDLFFPDHVAALTAALERSGAHVAHADVMTAFLRGTDDDWTLYGVESNMSRAVDASSLLVSNQIGATSTMFRRSCLEGRDPFDATIPYYRDYELWLRLALKYDFVHVERITSCYTIRNQGAKQQSVMWRDQTVVAYEAIYKRHPIENRPLLAQRREQIMHAAHIGQMDLQAQPAGEVQPVPWPLWSDR